MEILDPLKLIKDQMPDDPEQFSRFVHFSWCINQIGKAYTITLDEFEDLYVGLVSGEDGSLPEKDIKTTESYLKLFYCIVEYGRYIIPYEKWILENPENEQWSNIVIESSNLLETYEEDPEKWISQFKAGLENKKETNE